MSDSSPVASYFTKNPGYSREMCVDRIKSLIKTCLEKSNPSEVQSQDDPSAMRYYYAIKTYPATTRLFDPRFILSDGEIDDLLEFWTTERERLCAITTSSSGAPTDALEDLKDILFPLDPCTVTRGGVLLAQNVSLPITTAFHTLLFGQTGMIVAVAGSHPSGLMNCPGSNALTVDMRSVRYETLTRTANLLGVDLSGWVTLVPTDEIHTLGTNPQCSAVRGYFDKFNYGIHISVFLQAMYVAVFHPDMPEKHSIILLNNHDGGIFHVVYENGSICVRLSSDSSIQPVYYSIAIRKCVYMALSTFNREMLVRGGINFPAQQSPGSLIPEQSFPRQVFNDRFNVFIMCDESE